MPELIRANSRLSLWPEKVRGESNYINVLVPLRVKGKDVASLYMYIYNISSVYKRGWIEIFFPERREND